MEMINIRDNTFIHMLLKKDWVFLRNNNRHYTN